MATPTPSSSRRSRPLLSVLFRIRRSTPAAQYDLYSDSPYLNISPPISPHSPSLSSSSSSLSLSSSSLPAGLSISSSSPFIHHRPKPLKPRVALDERSPAAALARGQAAQRGAPRGSRRRTNLSALLPRHRQQHHHSHSHNHDHSHGHNHHHNHTNSHNHHHHHPGHFDVVGNDTVSEQGVPVFRGRVPRYPEPNTRRRASSAAAEVRFARANLSGSLGGDAGGANSNSGSGGTRMRERSASVSIASSSRPSISARAFDVLEATEDALIRRAAARGASNTPLVRRLRALRGERAELQRNWITELEHIAAEVEALPVRKCQCVIDLADIEAGQLVVRLPCMHVFHAECILPWFAKQEHPKCPIDRCPIPKDQIANLPVWRWGDE